MALTRKELFIVARSTFRVLRDSEQTGEIHTTEELTGRSRFHRLLRRYLDSHEADAILRERPELCAAQVDYDALRGLPADTLGAAYIRHLDDNGLTADAQATATQYIDDPDVAYLMRRFGRPTTCGTPSPSWAPRAMKRSSCTPSAGANCGCQCRRWWCSSAR